MSTRLRRAWFLVALLVLGPLHVSASAGPCCGMEQAQAVDSCCAEPVEVAQPSCACCAPDDQPADDKNEPCSGCECPLGMVAGTAPVLVVVESAVEPMSEEVITESAHWSRTLTPRVVQFDLLDPPKA